MSSETLVAVRLADLSTQFEEVKQTGERLSEVDLNLHARVSGRLDELAEQCGAALADIRSDGGNSAEWEKLRTAQKHLGLLSRETLAFTEGALLRQKAVDDGFCTLADKLLDHFNAAEPRLNWRGFTILAETAFLGEIGEVVRLRFPEISVWHLPVAAHEFGHYASPTIRVELRDGSFRGADYPVEAFLRDKWDRTNQKPWFHSHEFMADMFAVYTLGAAYAFCVLFLRPDAGALRAETTTHPSWNARYKVIVEMLSRIVAHGGVSPQVVRSVEEAWQASRSTSAGTREPDAAEVGKIINFFHPILDANLRGVRYATFGRAQQLVGPLRDGDPVEHATIPDILNAAWLARLYDVNDERATARIARNAIRACEAA